MDITDSYGRTVYKLDQQAISWVTPDENVLVAEDIWSEKDAVKWVRNALQQFDPTGATT